MESILHHCALKKRWKVTVDESDSYPETEKGFSTVSSIHYYSLSQNDFHSIEDGVLLLCRVHE